MIVKKGSPIYEKLVHDMEKKISSGEWKQGEKLPGERELCNIYGVARGTVKAALMTLQDMGLIRQVQGSGTYVEISTCLEKNLEHQADVLVENLAQMGLGSEEIMELGKFVLRQNDFGEYE